jgi:phage/conjugal plasmid C-4 type zinc finger TraR family protein
MGPVTDEIDRAQGFETFRRELELRAVAAGAHQLATPAGFGLCDDCTLPIAAARLRAVPGARRCAHCQGLRESAGLVLDR